MKSKSHCRSFINRKSIAFLAAVVLMVSAAVDVASAKTAKEINAGVNACLDRFYKQVNGGKELAGKAKGCQSALKIDPLSASNFDPPPRIEVFS
jgi:ABC-type sugar transport system substrate-binding protein